MKMHSLTTEKQTYHADPESPPIYVAMSTTCASHNAVSAPAKAVSARKPPPLPMMAIVGTYIV